MCVPVKPSDAASAVRGNVAVGGREIDTIATPCAEPAHLNETASPFSKIIVLDYYDGPISGVAQCARCDAAYVFQMLDWDEDQDIRTYSLSPLPSESFARLVQALTALGEPKWPVWVPIWTFPTESIRQTVEREVGTTLQAKGPPTSMISSSDNLTSFAVVDDLSLDGLAQMAHVGGAFDWLLDEPDSYSLNDGEPV